jgi:spore maturation protein SpmB
MVKILVPISLFTALLKWTGWLDTMDFIIQPVMSLLGLPAMAALPLVSGLLTGVYGGIAAMAVLPFTREQMTLMAVFILISHNMIQEGVIQSKSGINPVKATLFRLAASAVTVMVMSHFMDGGSQEAQELASAAASTSEPFLFMLRNWAVETSRLVFKIFFIIMALLTVMEVLKTLGWMDRIVLLFSPVLRLLGLSTKVGILWITAVVFGLAYGAAVIVEEAKKGDMTKEELEELQLSIGINHSMVEDPTLFLALGLSAFWLWVPRLVTAILVVHVLRLWRLLRGRRAAACRNKA